MAATVSGILLTGNHASRPGSGVSTGTLYACSTHSLVYQTTDTGATWVTWATLGIGDATTHIADTTAAHAASSVGFTPAGTIAATDVQAAIEEVASEVGATAHPTVTLGPYYIADLPGTATTQAQLGYYNTSSAVSLASKELRMSAACHVIGVLISSDAARTAGTATLQVRIGGVATAFNGGACVLDGTSTDRNSSFVAHSSGLAVSAASSVGVAIVTSSWTPTTANIVAYVVVSLD